MTSPYAALMVTCERIANDRQLPGFITDWAAELYDRLINPSAMILSNDLHLLSIYAEDAPYGAFVIDAALARRRSS